MLIILMLNILIISLSIKSLSVSNKSFSEIIIPQSASNCPNTVDYLHEGMTLNVMRMCF